RLSSLFENWESEFLQMGSFVLLTVWLRQRGSAESRPLDLADEKPPKPPPLAEQPWPVRKGGLWKALYAHSLSIALGLLFLGSFLAHLRYSWAQAVDEALSHGQPPPAWVDHLASSALWFESMQNWQSEFLSVVTLCVLSIYLREKDSTQSKPLEARHTDTGS